MARPLLTLTIATLLTGCDRSEPAGAAEAGPTVAASATPAAAPPVASAVAEAAAPAARRMPPRPVPTTSPTVLVTMPVEVQLQAIQYMSAMQAPQPDDAPADPEYARQIADRLRGAGRPDVISSGRLIDVKVDRGCEAGLPKQLIARNTGATLGVLLAHGVLVVRCTDKQIQCLQSTRDADDVLCTRR